ncbi:MULTISPECIES: hypothetical protein [Hydrocarboniphaga]|jgi:hypothetical protein|uniref:Uncharacterized protein n=1 Tax=Hydrocarboniphaga effusa AP103 TaxID=1172194 RepID=I8T888_9GAMM|nr:MULTISPECIES: hypothetical protein [Hydrocarboniphaga]EIT69978.1 hypothetical protein WQQ_01150 [Hydrocarboniphaga effusa AP103]EIT70165.1 hypothetical protein WQQ_03020 [Hydrocarboniphaga effusa AP103]MDZ4077206.1 hypothetical protein [Hydrocarboniphaga sp.]
MARKPKPKPQAEPAKNFDEFAEESEGLEEDVNVEPVEAVSAGKLRDWRDVEKLKEMRELRRLVGDDFDLLDDVRPRR